MRYVALIAVVDFLALVIADRLVGGNAVGGPLGAFFITLFGIPFAIIVGMPMLWLARKLRLGSALVLMGLGTIAGSVTGPLVATLMGLPSNTWLVTVGAALGLLSSGLWWLFVERRPDLRAHYD